MRNLILPILTAAFLGTSLAAEAISDGDRQRLLAHLDMTESWLLSEIDDLSDAQLRFRMTPGSWSIMDVVEHLAIAEPQYWERVQNSMKQPPTTDKIQGTDAAILWYGIDRTRRTTTGEARVPKGKWHDISGSLGEFRKLRATMKEYAKTTDDDLRSRKTLEGDIDVYQWFLMISTHSQRHILQIREIKTHANFPKS